MQTKRNLLLGVGFNPFRFWIFNAVMVTIYIIRKELYKIYERYFRVGDL
jgi:hypothetical protein